VAAVSPVAQDLHIAGMGTLAALVAGAQVVAVGTPPVLVVVAGSEELEVEIAEEDIDMVAWAYLESHQSLICLADLGFDWNARWVAMALWGRLHKQDDHPLVIPFARFFHIL